MTVLMRFATLGVILTLWGPVERAMADDTGSRPVLTVSQNGQGDYLGDDQEPIVAAIGHLPAAGGTVVVSSGQYTICKPIRLPSNVTIRGGEGTRLKLPSPVRVMVAAEKGQAWLAVADTSEFAVDTTVDVFPREPKPEENRSALSVAIKEIGPGKLILAEPLPCNVESGSRVGYRHNVFDMRGTSAKNVRFEKLTIDGGLKEDIPMPGHCDRCAILAHGRFSYETGPTAPPIENLQVVNCHFQNCYGRGVAMYSVIKSQVENCHFDNIDDEAIDLDHFCYHCRVVGNRVERAKVGVCLNDASYCLVERNHVENCSNVGITIWWWYKCPMGGIDVENVIQNNRVLCSKSRGISIGKRCFRNKVLNNEVSGGIHVAEPNNEVAANTLL